MNKLMIAKTIMHKIKSGIFGDFLLSIIASIISTVVTQLIAYPYLSRIMSAEEYGIVLTIIAMVNTIGVALGNSLNNARILMQKEYEEKQVEGDYNVIFVMILLVNILITTFSLFLICETINLTVIGGAITSILLLFRAYYSVDYRIHVSYKKNLICNAFGAVGCIIGLIITSFTDIWITTFLMSELFSCIYIIFTSRIIKEKFVATILLRQSINKYIYILSAAVLSTMMTYMDRFFIYPILGPEQVSIYNVASFLGKTLGIIMIPISGVLLTYYAKEKELSIKDFSRRIIIFFMIGSVFYIGIILVGLPVTRVLYPTLVNDAKPYFYIANLSAIIFILGNTIQPTLLRFGNTKWQPVIQIIYLITYLGLGYMGMIEEGLMGFCMGVLIANIIKIIIMVVIMIISLHRLERKGVRQ